MASINQGNQHAKKPDDEVKSSWLKMRVRPADKGRWVKEAHARGMKLTEYVEYKLNQD